MAKTLTRNNYVILQYCTLSWDGTRCHKLHSHKLYSHMFIKNLWTWIIPHILIFSSKTCSYVRNMYLTFSKKCEQNVNSIFPRYFSKKYQENISTCSWPRICHCDVCKKGCRIMEDPIYHVRNVHCSRRESMWKMFMTENRSLWCVQERL